VTPNFDLALVAPRSKPNTLIQPSVFLSWYGRATAFVEVVLSERVWSRDVCHHDLGRYAQGFLAAGVAVVSLSNTSYIAGNVYTIGVDVCCCSRQ
jgi:hypothetical protein